MATLTGSAKIGTRTFAPTATITLPAVAATGFPGAANTGVPAGTVLTPSGAITVTKAGTMVTGKTITGPIDLGPVAQRHVPELPVQDAGELGLLNEQGRHRAVRSSTASSTG